MTKRIPGWVVYIPHLNAAYPIAYWVRDSVAVTITDDYGTTRTNRFMADTLKQLKGLEGHARSGAHAYAKIVLRERIVAEQKMIESLADLNHQFKPDQVKHLVRVYKQATRQYAKLDEILGGA